MSTLSIAGRVALSEIIFNKPLHLAWGSGDGLWTVNPPTETGLETGLRAEIARRALSQLSYVTPDPIGAILVSNGSFTVSATPTRHLYMRADFGYDEAIGASIREVGLFMGSVMVAGLPAGQKYFLPAQVADPGRMIMLKNYPVIYRFPDNRERFEFVMTF